MRKLELKELQDRLDKTTDKFEVIGNEHRRVTVKCKICNEKKVIQRHKVGVNTPRCEKCNEQKKKALVEQKILLKKEVELKKEIKEKERIDKYTRVCKECGKKYIDAIASTFSKYKIELTSKVNNLEELTKEIISRPSFIKGYDTAKAYYNKGVIPKEYEYLFEETKTKHK